MWFVRLPEAVPMRAVTRRSPFFRIALLGLAVLFAHSLRGNTQPILPVHPPCPGKVAAAQPDPEKKLSPAGKRLVMPGHFAGRHHLLGGSFGFTPAHAAALLSPHSAAQIAAARWTVYVAPQRRPFALRI